MSFLMHLQVQSLDGSSIDMSNCKNWHLQVCAAVGKYYLVDSGYVNRPGFLSPYRGTKYHIQDFQNAAEPRGKKEMFNYAHSSLGNVIERAFGVLKMKWRILSKVPSYPPNTQTHTIVACFALHNFIRLSARIRYRI